MREVPGGVRDHEPFVQYTSFATANIGFQVMLRSQDFSGQSLISTSS